MELEPMTHRFPLKLIGSAIFLFLLVGFSYAAETQKPIKIAILPCNNIEITFKKFYPLIRYLIQRTNIEMRIVVPADFTAF